MGGSVFLGEVGDKVKRFSGVANEREGGLRAALPDRADLMSGQLLGRASAMGEIDSHDTHFLSFTYPVYKFRIPDFNI